MVGSLLVTGGVRSGKSFYAEARVRACRGRPTLIETTSPRDEEMAARIAAQKARRGTDWITVREPLGLVRAIRETDGTGPRLVECLAGWLSNVMLDRFDWFESVRELETAVAEQNSPLVLVSSEIGGGAPASTLTRRYQEAVGLMNQAIAEIADEVVVVIAGQPLTLKPPGHWTA
ncbi:adenosylcobinamide kinase /adenosylcobinamide-phosphate guanylyltransferase [Rhodovulum sp. ES.010]|uniref:bifunctional adenosylcobinamide kinase/adenosylcobinamide-phosphate guanylyltransferase n=1 Tax=Rhodovulum sp. ES.010 TaxID=1882821 RepID=UPI00092954A7|nr:bifunctional adenosylcobinamide kinase/adenosylcobinamide-phosphate guanylyltransferase [Rhodovulum sp. ES.010]SIO40714.1 adenosylcobinamide kinase /adenosylcobinamide-phosphate guanylyltransferase [Rhodovulum sp. ES.010]